MFCACLKMLVCLPVVGLHNFNLRLGHTNFLCSADPMMFTFLVNSSKVIWGTFSGVGS